MATSASTVSLDTFNELVSNIYDAAMDATLWPVFIERLTLALNAHSGLLRIQDLQVNEVGPYVTHGVNPEYQQKYVEYYIHDDPLIDAAAQHPIGTPLQTAIFLPKSFRKTEFYNDYNHPQGMDQIIGGLLVKDESRIALIGVHRRDRVGSYEQQEVRLVELLIPHLQRAFQVNSHLFQLKDGISAAHDALHRLLVGIILVDATGKPLFVNSRADTILSQARGLTLGQHGLQARTWESTQALHKLIFEACQPPQKTGGALSIATPESPHPLNILVIPVNRERNVEFGIDTSQAVAALFIGTAGQQHNLSLNVLRNFYGLTHAEARLAGALANGHSLEKIAEKFSLSKNTIRTQLKSCFQKTGVHRQGELVQLILGDPA
ncbi:MAG: LuxR C-terminal-related transcriptional regulator [Gammaproteobacteria bacterium]